MSCLPHTQNQNQNLQGQLLTVLTQLMVLHAGTETGKSTDNDSAPKELSKKMLTILATGPYASGFKNALVSLPPSARHTLQVDCNTVI